MLTKRMTSAGEPGAAASAELSNGNLARGTADTPALRTLAGVQRPRLGERAASGTAAKPPITTQFQNLAGQIAGLFGRADRPQSSEPGLEKIPEDSRPLLLVAIAAIQELSGAMHEREAEIAALRKDLGNAQMRMRRLETWLTS